MWGQGKKESPDKPELSASSIAITIAALQVYKIVFSAKLFCFSSSISSMWNGIS